MDEKKILESLNRAVGQLVPDTCENLLETPVKKDEQIVQYTTREHVFPVWFTKIAAMAAGLVLCFIIGSMWIPEDFAEVSIDVNPGIEIKVNDGNEIISAQATNEEGEDILRQISINHLDMQEGVDLIIQKMYQESYLKKGEENFALISVCLGKRMKQNTEEHLESQIKKSIEKTNVKCQVITQRLQKTSHVEKTAKEYHLTQGKAGLIERILQQEGNTYTKEQLAAMQVKELLILIKENNMQQMDDGLNITVFESKKKTQEKYGKL